LSRGEDDGDVNSFAKVVQRSADFSSEKDAILSAHQENLPIELKFEEILDDVSREIVRSF
jgi:hypothetical protein